MPLCKHAVPSLLISSSSKRQGQRVLYKYFKTQFKYVVGVLFFPPTVTSPPFLRRVEATFCGGFFFFFLPVSFCPDADSRASLRSLNRFSEDGRHHHCRPWRFLLFHLFFCLPTTWTGRKLQGGRERERKKMKEATAVSLSRVLTPSQVPLHSPSSPPLSSPSLPSPCLLLWPISAEQWSVKKFPISKFTHCINLV